MENLSIGKPGTLFPGLGLAYYEFKKNVVTIAYCHGQREG
jgi:hypothetical protein